MKVSGCETFSLFHAATQWLVRSFNLLFDWVTPHFPPPFSLFFLTTPWLPFTSSLSIACPSTLTCSFLFMLLLSFLGHVELEPWETLDELGLEQRAGHVR